LEHLGEEFGYSLQVVPPVKIGDQLVSSSQVRASLREGDVERTAELLGRPYSVPGEVVEGDGRGRNIGIPTANLKIWPERAIPKAGVYACLADVSGETVGAVTNVGFRPTFENQPPSPIIETHLLDFDGDIYGREIRLEFLIRLRDERRFPSVQALVDQIHQDIARTREALTV
jgi:riboflavin kinase / FMN adenylyltransferase